MDGVVAVAGFILCLLATQILGEGLGIIVAKITGPIRRPLWHLFQTASWPWPLLLLVSAGISGVALGFSSLDKEGRWIQYFGPLAVIAGGFTALVSPLLWRDARRSRFVRSANNDDADH